ncbi:Mitochondrial genome maintenance [Penicillium verhagenii]|uniref:Mitochondrial genome maintenance n=1 Tax=Penicillium verhagenii TaxID=1562060 RepID=UPI002544EE49|nr:Mitochondrial genome maintenance [Penicillium verhagenii]KAJ5938665.1 Mitochondrial genome maintenance [Penicillium verhagenii]
MSSLRCRPWRVLESFQQMPSLAQAPRSKLPTQYLSQGKRAISTSNYRANSTSTPSPASKPTTPIPARTATPYTPSTQSKPTPTATPNRQTTDNISKSGLSDKPLDVISAAEEKIDWTRSFHGLSAEPFPEKAANILLAEIDPHQVEIKPDGIVYLPEIKYRRVLNQAFGPGAWGLVPRSESIVTPKTVTREYALVCHGRLVSVARGEQDYFSPDGIPTATEGCRSNALVRCCKDLGIASELWDPRWIRMYKAKYAREVFVEHIVSKKKSKIWVRKDDAVSYPWKENK